MPGLCVLNYSKPDEDFKTVSCVGNMIRGLKALLKKPTVKQISLSCDPKATMEAWVVHSFDHS